MSLVMDPPAHPALAAADQLDQALDALATANLWSLSNAELLELRGRLQQVNDRLAGHRHQATGEISARDATVAAHQVQTTSWLTNALRLHPGEAAREVRLGTALRTDLPATAAALAAGTVGVAAAEVIAGTDRALAATATAAQRREA